MKKVTYVTHPYPNKEYFGRVAQAFASFVSSNSKDYFVELLTVGEYSALYNDGKALTDAEYINLVDSGKAQVGHLNISSLYEKNRLLQVLSIPYAISTLSQVRKVMPTLGASLLDGVSENSKTKVLGYATAAQKAFLGNRISADLEAWPGLVATSFGFANQLNDDYLTLLGLSLFKSRSPTDIDAAIYDGVIDLREIAYLPNQELSTCSNLEFFLKTDHGLTFSFFCANQDFFNSLNSADRELFMAAANSAMAVDRHTDAPPLLNGASLVTVTEDQKEKLKAQAQGVIHFYPELQEAFAEIRRLTSIDSY